MFAERSFMAVLGPGILAQPVFLQLRVVEGLYSGDWVYRLRPLLFLDFGSRVENTKTYILNPRSPYPGG